MPDGTWTATDVRMDKVVRTMQKYEGVNGEQRYQASQGCTLLAADGSDLEVQPHGKDLIDVAWADVPQNVKDALIAVNAWHKTKKLEQYGIAP